MIKKVKGFLELVAAVAILASLWLKQQIQKLWQEL